jgi:hypothetical protein
MLTVPHASNGILIASASHLTRHAGYACDGALLCPALKLLAYLLNGSYLSSTETKVRGKTTVQFAQPVCTRHHM